MFNKFEYVYAVYIHKSFTKAAQALFISQPSLSTAIKKIELKIGSPIFERNGHEINLTEIGVEYIKTAELMLLLRKNFNRKMNDIYSLESGNIHIGATNYLCSFIIPKIIKEFKKLYPKIEIVLDEANSMSLCKNLDEEKIDILIDSFNSPDENYVSLPLSKEHILLCVPSNWEVNNDLKEYQVPLENGKLLLNSNTPFVPLNKFKKSNFVLLKKGHDMNKRAMNIFEEAKINPPIAFYVDQLNISYSLATSSMGACFVTDTIVNCSSIPQNSTFYKIASKYNSRTLFISYKKSRYCTIAMKKFIDVALKNY